MPVIFFQDECRTGVFEEEKIHKHYSLKPEKSEVLAAPRGRCRKYLEKIRRYKYNNKLGCCGTPFFSPPGRPAASCDFTIGSFCRKVKRVIFTWRSALALKTIMDRKESFYVERYFFEGLPQRAGGAHAGMAYEAGGQVHEGIHGDKGEALVPRDVQDP
ncbi:MAG: hypothetical protein ACE5GY_01985 [Thermodesulfobacteriota bacterium]